MPRTAKIVFTTAIIALPLAAGGCVQQEKYDSMRMSHLSLKEQMVALEGERDEAKANLDTVREHLGRATSELNGVKQKYNLVDADIQKLLADNDALLKRVSGLDFGPLPTELSEDLEQLAAQNPDLLTFDAKRGMLRFASDFTFGSGSAELSSSASSSLSSLATILNSATASKFEVRIVGHTDNVRISQPKTRQMHPTNWHLSVHRAISVGDGLSNSGVSPMRIQVAGYGEFRPVVPNPPRGGAAQNRRVEIFLVPMPANQLAAPTISATAQPMSNDEIAEPMK